MTSSLNSRPPPLQREFVKAPLLPVERISIAVNERPSSTNDSYLNRTRSAPAHRDDYQMAGNFRVAGNSPSDASYSDDFTAPSRHSAASGAPAPSRVVGSLTSLRCSKYYFFSCFYAPRPNSVYPLKGSERCLFSCKVLRRKGRQDTKRVCSILE